MLPVQIDDLFKQDIVRGFACSFSACNECLVGYLGTESLKLPCKDSHGNITEEIPRAPAPSHGFVAKTDLERNRKKRGSMGALLSSGFCWRERLSPMPENGSVGSADDDFKSHGNQR